MTRLRCLLLGSVLALSGTAQAADLPASGAAPVEYVRVCSAYGAGFFYVPAAPTPACVSAAACAPNSAPSSRSAATITPSASGPRPSQHRLRTATAAWPPARLSATRSRRTRRARAARRITNQPVVNSNLAQAFVQFGGRPPVGRDVLHRPRPAAPHFGDLRYNDPSIVNHDLRVYLRVRRRARHDRGRGRPDAPPRCRPGDRLAPGTDALVYGGQTVPDLVGNPLKEPGARPSSPVPCTRSATSGVPPTLDGRRRDTGHGASVRGHGVWLGGRLPRRRQPSGAGHGRQRWWSSPPIRRARLVYRLQQPRRRPERHGRPDQRRHA